MPVTIDPDLIRDSGLVEQYNAANQLIYAQIDRTFYVTGLDSSADVPTQAVAEVKGSSYSAAVGSPHAIYTMCTARNFRFQPTADPHGGEVVVTYIFANGGFPETEYTIECTGGLQTVLTDSEYDDASGDLKPIQIRYNQIWAKMGDPEPSGVGEVMIGTGADMPVDRPIGGIMLTKTVSEAKAAAIEAAQDTYLGKTNSTVFRSRAVNTMRCDLLVTRAQPYRGIYVAQAHWSFNPMTWDQWARFRNDQFGVHPNLWRDTTDGYTQVKSNGFKRCKAYQRAEMNNLLTLITS